MMQEESTAVGGSDLAVEQKHMREAAAALRGTIIPGLRSATRLADEESRIAERRLAGWQVAAALMETRERYANHSVSLRGRLGGEARALDGTADGFDETEETQVAAARALRPSPPDTAREVSHIVGLNDGVGAGPMPAAGVSTYRSPVYDWGFPTRGVQPAVADAGGSGGAGGEARGGSSTTLPGAGPGDRTGVPPEARPFDRSVPEPPSGAATVPDRTDTPGDIPGERERGTIDRTVSPQDGD